MARNTKHVNPDIAFKNAIADDVLHQAPYHPAYAGNYMYMHTVAEGDSVETDYFKHIDTRQYVSAIRIV